VPGGSESRQTKLLHHGRLACYTTAPELRSTPAAPEPLASRCHFWSGLEQVVGEIPAAVFVIKAESRSIVYAKTA
jgi:hypothetical protein